MKTEDWIYEYTRAITLACFFAILTIIIILWGMSYLNSQEETQEERPVCNFKNGYWGFTAMCDYWDWGIRDKHHYTDKMLCETYLNQWLNDKHCKVIN